MNRRKKLYLNTVTALISQFVALICGFILPRYVLSYFGSDVNGLTTSISRFLSVITFLELGVGPVIQSNLYKPLANNDTITISRIVVSAEKFYRRIAYIFLLYLLALLVIFPLNTPEYSWWFTASLIIIISISTFAQYFFGITYQTFLNADQKGYVQNSLQIITIVLNTIISVVLMKIGCSLHVVKLASAFVFVIRPIVQNLYVKKHYYIDKTITYTEEPIKQKWNGFAQHLAAVVTSEIDVVLLTFFSTYQNVSIYSVYLLVVNGITKMIMTGVSGLEAFWGNIIAKKETELLHKTFQSMESLIHMAVTFLFVVTAITITPFVSVYTSGIEDSASYCVPLFGIILTFSYGAQCLRIPYFRIIKAAGHYKQTQNGAFVSMLINIFLSLTMVIKFGLVGVAVGTLVALLYHTIYFAWYLRKNILNRSFMYFIKHIIIDVTGGVICFLAAKHIQMNDISYFSWIVYALIVSLIAGSIIFAINFLFYKNDYVYIIKKVLKKT